MTIQEFLERGRKAEYPTFVNVLKALLAGRFDYRPHERSPSAAEIAWTLARETKACCDVIDSGRVNWTEQPPPARIRKLLSLLSSSTMRHSATASMPDR